MFYCSICGKPVLLRSGVAVCVECGDRKASLKYRVVTPVLGIQEQAGDRIPLTLPKGATLIPYIWEPDAEGLIYIEYHGQQLKMYLQDLRHNCERVPSLANDSSIDPSFLAAPLAQQDGILRILRERLHSASERREKASARFTEALQLPSGIPHPDGTAKIQQASREFTSAVREVVRAARAITNFLLHGAIPPEEEAEDQRRASQRN